MNYFIEMDQELKNSILKTGTTILGIVCKDGIVMAADRQTTAGNIVMNKNKEKVIQLNDYLVFSGCGLAAASDRIKKILPAELKLKELRARTRPTIRQAANLLSSIIYSTIRQPSMVPDEIGALIAGVNEDGSFELYTIDPAGSIQKVTDYNANFGSGMPYVLGFMERNWKQGQPIEAGVKQAVEALKSSTQRDTGSGYGIDVFTLTKEGIKKVIEQEIVPDFKDRKSEE